MASSIGSRDSVSFLLTIQATGFLTFTLVGLPPTEYASLRWTHPHALRIPPHDGHPALRGTAWTGSRSALAVSGFRLRARLGFSIPVSSPRPARHYPRVRIRHSSFERRRDFNPPEQRAAQRTLRDSPPLPCVSVLLASRGCRLCLFPYHRRTGSQVPYQSQG
jgi:hypothetical protein